MRQFSRSLFGANPAEVREFLLAAAATLERVNNELAGVLLERTTLQTALKHAHADVESLRAELSEARKKLDAFQGQEAALARAVLDARQVGEELNRRTKEQAERTLAEADAAAKQTIETARRSAAELLRATREHAQQAVEAAERTAAARMAEVQIEADRVTAEVRAAAVEVRRATQQQIEQFIGRLEAFLGDREDLTENLDSLAKHHVASLDLMKRLHGEVEREILPILRDLTHTVTGKDVKAPSSPVPVPPAPERRGPERDAGEAPAARPSAEIVVSPVHSYLQATKLVTSVSRMKGVQAARLRSYSHGTITIDVVTEGGSVTGVDPRQINGGPLDVVEASDNRMVLRLAGAEPGRTAGSAGRN